MKPLSTPLMDSQPKLHVVFFPFMAQGHIIPTLDLAKLFSSRGLTTTIISTESNSSAISNAIERSKNLLGLEIAIRLIRFPALEAGLPEGCENLDQLRSPDMLEKFFKALPLLREQLEQVLQDLSPDCLVADMFFPWSTDAAAKFGIPRLVFHGLSLFALCCSENLRFYKPFDNVSSDTDPFVLPNFPHEVEFSRAQLPPFELGEAPTLFMEILTQVKESEARSLGVLVNSFKELERDYVDYFREVWGRRTWLVGPVLLCNRECEDKAQRGKTSSIDEKKCLEWLDSKKSNSVIYACFGSVAPLSAAQLHEIALGLEASGHAFIWVLKKGNEGDEKWLPEGFEERNKDKGLVIRGWAPQVLILEHESTGAFITHCGWNSALEAVCAGVPVVTLPTFAEQPFNEKLLTQVLKVGIPVGSPLLNRATSMVKRDEVSDAVKRIMEGEDAVEMRSRARALKEMAFKAVKEGGSSYNELSALIEEIKANKLNLNMIPQS